MDIKSDMENLVRGIEDEFECAKLCRQHPQCEYFIWVPNNNFCFVKWLLKGEPWPASHTAPGYSQMKSSYVSCHFPPQIDYKGKDKGLENSEKKIGGFFS